MSAKSNGMLEELQISVIIDFCSSNKSNLITQDQMLYIESLVFVCVLKCAFNNVHNTNVTMCLHVINYLAADVELSVYFFISNAFFYCIMLSSACEQFVS